ncbi:MAG: YciI family protein [Ferruginibacter sp.]
MNEYLMIFRNTAERPAIPPTAEQMQTAVAQWQDWIRGIVSDGKYVGANRLLTEAKMVRPGNIVSDGPYAESKEVVGGFLIVKAETIGEAMEMAKGCPDLLYGGNVEVRTMMSMEQDHNSVNFLEPK